MVTIGVAIPCYHGHIQHLKYTLDSIENQTRKPDMVVVSCSGVSSTPYNQSDYTFPVQFITTENKQSASKNRNVAASYLDTDIISFFDADDQMHPQRLEVIERAFKENDIVLFLHNFIREPTTPHVLYDISSTTFDIGKIGIHSWGFGALHLDNPLFNNSTLDIHNGHSSVTRTLFDTIKFNESPSCYGKEDSVFTADIIRAYPTKTGYCSLPLTKYFPCGSAYSCAQ